MAERTVAFVNLAGFVALSEAHGASTAADLATRFGELARHAATPPAQIVKTIGDAVMLAAPDPDSWLTATIALVAACRCATRVPARPRRHRTTARSTSVTAICSGPP